jgi:YidC/Oxa1 family membrane protein insertase
VLTIIVFTVLTRLITFPLTQQQIKSSKGMQEIQPLMKKLQEKYKNDREKLASEQMRLYREHGVNPLMGCLPLLIQMPILLGLYGAISRALGSTPLQLLDLNHRLLGNDVLHLSRLVPMQNQFLWLNLAQPDHLFILPVLVVVTTWLQSKLMTPAPTSNDPKDPSAAMARNMTVMMPLMIGLFSLQFASGLSMYWIVSNVSMIAQYALMGKVDIRNLIGGGAPRPSPVVVEEVEEAPKKKALPSNTRETAAKMAGAKKKTGSTAKAKASKAK